MDANQRSPLGRIKATGPDLSNKHKTRYRSHFQRQGLLGLCLVSATVALGGQLAADDGMGTVSDQLQALQEKIDSLESSNQAMKHEMDQLKSEQHEQWLTEERAEQVRALVQDVMADADTRASLMGDGLMAGWKDHFFLASADGRFKLEIAGQIQTRFLYNWTSDGGVTGDSEVYGFENPLTRLIFKGHVFGKDIQYHIAARFNFDSAFRLQNKPDGSNFNGTAQYTINANKKPPSGLFLDSAWLRFRLYDWLSVRFGQFKVPFNREELVSLPHQLAAAPSLANQRMALGYSQGVEATYHSGPVKFSVAFTNAVPMMDFADNTAYAPTSATIPDNGNFLASGRLEYLLNGQWHQFRQFTSPITNEFGILLGVAGFYQQGEETDFRSFDDADEVYGATADISVDWGGASAFGSVIWEQGKGITLYDPGNPELRNTTMTWVVQGGVYLAPKWELFARYEGGYAHRTNKNTGAELETPDLSILTVGVNHYIDGQDIRWTVDCGVSFAELDSYWVFNSRLLNPQSAPTGWVEDNDNGSKPQVLLRTQFQLLF